MAEAALDPEGLSADSGTLGTGHQAETVHPLVIQLVAAASAHGYSRGERRSEIRQAE